VCRLPAITTIPQQASPPRSLPSNETLSCLLSSETSAPEPLPTLSEFGFRFDGPRLYSVYGNLTFYPSPRLCRIEPEFATYEVVYNNSIPIQVCTITSDALSCRQNARILHYFARKMPEIYIIIALKIFSPNFLGARPPSAVS